MAVRDRQGREFIAPRTLKAQLEAKAATLSPGTFIRNPKYQHFKDIWCAAHFGIGYERNVRPCTVWVNNEQNSDTDFVLKTNVGEFAFQTTIADVPGRRMSDEYQGEVSRTRFYRPGRGSEEGPTWIAEAVHRKVHANYSAAASLNILAYANFDTNGLDYGVVRAKVAPLAHSFASIWVVTNDQICSVGAKTLCGELPGMYAICDPLEL